MFWFETSHPETDERIEVEAVYRAGWRGSRDCYGAALEPDDSEEVVISYAWNQAGEAIDFDEFEEELIAQGMRIARRG